MKRTPLNKIGKTGKANIEARKRIAAIAEEKGLNQCEIHLFGCLYRFALAPAHKHKRSWYKGDVEKLSDYTEWVAACQNCHNLIENDSQLTAQVFANLRPSPTVEK